MSRRAPAGPDHTEQNRAALKSLVKLEANKSCADCKRNKHPRWASWTIGVFLCIRCSGIHRGMGTHISRVKSVDLDSWTDEQVQSMLRWGNARANKYWEHKLAEGHVPNESKIENFIRTKYDSKRWVMDGPMPDPSTLDDGDAAADDDVPLNVVREKAIERSASLKNGSAAGVGVSPPPRRQVPAVDLFGDSEEQAPQRSASAQPAVSRPGPPKASAAPPKSTKPGESLLGLDFLGAPSAAPVRPANSGSGTSAAAGRADLKSSILSLYASKPAAPPSAPQPQQAVQSNMDAFAGMQSPSFASPTSPQHSAQRSTGGLNDAFSSLSFTSAQPQSQGQPSSFSSLMPSSGHMGHNVSPAPLGGGSFFDTKPAPPPKATSPTAQVTIASGNSGFGGDFGAFSSGPSPPTSNRNPPANTGSMSDLFDMSTPPQNVATPTAAPAPARNQAQLNSYRTNSAFNLSQPAPQPVVSKPAVQPAATFSNINSADAWASNDAWATPDPPAPKAAPPMQTSTVDTFSKPAPPPAMQTAFDSGWGDVASPTKSAGGMNVQQDEEFGGWSHASPVATPSAAPKQGSGGGSGFASTSDDLFGNVWG